MSTPCGLHRGVWIYIAKVWNFSTTSTAFPQQTGWHEDSFYRVKWFISRIGMMFFLGLQLV
jgi:hypothetical protein